MEAIEKSIVVQRHARYYQAGDIHVGTKRVWIVLHGYGQLGSYFIKHFQFLADAGECVIAPEGLSRGYLDGKWERVGASWMTKEDRMHEIEDYVKYLDALLIQLAMPVNAELVLLGFSQGTATAWRWLMQGNCMPDHLILWAGGPAHDTMQKAASKLLHPTLDIALGDKDEYVRMEQAQKQLEALQEMKPNAKLWPFEGNHRIDNATLRSIVDSW